MSRHMPLSQPLVKGILIKRYKRFLADVQLDGGERVTALCPNTGSMRSCAEPGRPVLLSVSEKPDRKYPHTWELIQMGKTWVGINTARPNQAVSHFVKAGAIPGLTGYRLLKREQKYGREGRSRIDLLLDDHEDGRPACYVEVKNTTMRVEDHAAFPDAVTTRGQKHLEELMDVVAQGMRAVMFYFVGRADCTRFRPADEIDPEYGRLLRRAVEGGVEIEPWRMKFSPRKLELVEKLPVDLS